MTDEKEFRLFAKYCSSPLITKTEGYFSWQFVFSDQDINEIKGYLKAEREFQIGLVCGSETLNKSEYAVLKHDTIEKLIDKGKTSVTLSRKKGERRFRISIGGGRENSLKIKTNELY